MKQPETDFYESIKAFVPKCSSEFKAQKHKESKIYLYPYNLRTTNTKVQYKIDFRRNDYPEQQSETITFKSRAYRLRILKTI